MSLVLLHVDRALTPREEIPDACILIDDTTIRKIVPRAALDVPRGTREIRAAGLTAVPGFVDVHVHGAGGHDVMEGTRDALGAVASTLARHGTTSFLATTVTASPEITCQSVEGIARHIESKCFTWNNSPSAEILGIHFEGPFLSTMRRGVHPPEWLTQPSVELLGRLLSAARGKGRILTLAPELPGTAPCIDAALASSLVVALGHTDATYEQARAAIARGARHAVHVYNAMRPFSHRDTGVIGAVLTSPEVTAELIADGVHVEDAAMRILLQTKGIDRVILVSDGTAATDMPDGKYTLGTFEVNVSGGVCRNSEGKLAGSTLTLDRALRNIVALGVPLPDALRMLTLNPARLLGLEEKKGVLRPGGDADIVLVDENLRVRSVWARGSPLQSLRGGSSAAPGLAFQR
jgi:N-acetylglucosamine-6-phosphate deacetylase